MTESEIQKSIYENFCKPKNHRLVTPNTKALGSPGESDLVSVTKSDLIHEFEIKTNKSDFKREFKEKNTKHWLLREHNNYDESSYYDPGSNYFWFAIHDFEVDIPEYAGLVEIHSDGFVVEKEAPRLHSQKMTERCQRYLERGLTVRLWE